MTYERLVEIIATQLNLGTSKVKEEANLKDLGADSLDVFQIMIALEEELGIEVSPAKAEKIRTVEQLWKLTQELDAGRQ
jgi:acyl carrier protein